VLPPNDDIRVEFTGRNLTKFGGIPLLKKFLIRFGFKGELQSTVPIEKRDSRFSLEGLLMCLIYVLILVMTILGSQKGLMDKPSIITLMVLIFSFSSVIYLNFDLDHPTKGFLSMSLERVVTIIAQQGVTDNDQRE
jgi:hypothetical protein